MPMLTTSLNQQAHALSNEAERQKLKLFLINRPPPPYNDLWLTLFKLVTGAKICRNIQKYIKIRKNIWNIWKYIKCRPFMTNYRCRRRKAPPTCVIALLWFTFYIFCIYFIYVYVFLYNFAYFCIFLHIFIYFCTMGHWGPKSRAVFILPGAFL